MKGKIKFQVSNLKMRIKKSAIAINSKIRSFSGSTVVSRHKYL